MRISFLLPIRRLVLGLRWPLARLLAALVGLGAGGCVEPYTPEVVSTNANLLVVDGFINGNGRSTFLLSRSLNIAATTTAPPEKGAKVFIVDNAGGRYPLPEKGSGTYQSDSLVLNPSRQYQLSILTNTNASYASDLGPLKVTPPIDKLSFQLADGQVQVLVSAHDASAQTKYYRWSCVETWAFTAAFGSALQYYPLKNGPNGNVLVDIRTTPIYECWRTERPAEIVQTTSAQLSQDAISNYVVRHFSQRAERVKTRYSVLVSQMAETAEEFAYREVLRKNTEAVGTVNDPLPSQLVGNLHRVGRPDEPVLGFVGAHTVQRQRFFISQADLPARDPNDYDTPYNACAITNIPFCDMQNICDVEGVFKLFASPDYVPLDFVAIPGSSLGGISSAPAACADCRTRGTTTKPSFW